MENKDRMTAIPAKKCPYPRCLDCPSYVAHEGERFCNVPMVISKQIYFDLRMEIARINNIIKDLENSLYDEILGLNGADKPKDTTEKGKRVYISCYSCPYSVVYGDGKEKTVHCNLSGRDLKLKARMSFPEWCERRKKKEC